MRRNVMDEAPGQDKKYGAGQQNPKTYPLADADRPSFDPKEELSISHSCRCRYRRGNPKGDGG
jgi:hypothetical protein